jgi:hypothetical protein
MSKKTRRNHMKIIRRATFSILFILTAVILAACTGAGEGGDSLGVGGGDFTTGAGVSKGVVTSSAAGNVVVNGITFSTAGAAVKIDDNPSAADLLKPGMVVTVKGSSDDAARTGSAIEIEARDALQGTIDDNGVDLVNKTITVMGQTVRIEDNVTRLNDDDNQKVFNLAAGFAPGQKVEVHGFIDDNGGLRATRVVKTTGTEFDVKGFVVSTGNPFGLSLTLGGTASFTVNGPLPTGAVLGSIVEVKSNTLPAAGGAITPVAINGVKLEDRLGANGVKVEVEGIVSSGDVNSFVVNGQKVITTDATVFEGGLKTDFALGARVEAEGPIDAAGIITATKISFRSNIRIEGDASNVTATSLQVLGKTIVINPAPMTRQDLIKNIPIANGDHVEVRAILGSDGTTLVASRIRARNPGTKAFLQGPVSAVDSTTGTLTILGNTISTSGAQFRASFDSSEAAVASAAFFAQVKPNVTVVKVKWDPFTSITAAVKEAEIEVGKTLTASGDISSKGVVTAKGSVFVNGVEFHTGGAAVMINGIPATEDKLQVGMVVKVRGTVDDATQTGTATLVEANDALAGTISAVGANTITVMGQTVAIEDNVTRLNDDNITTVKTFADAGFHVGERVEVHGLIDDQGGLRATRAVKKAGSEFQVKGFVVSTGNPFGLSLTPGGIASISVSGSLPAGGDVGSIVEVKATAAPANGVVTATLVKLEDRIGVAGEKVEVEGIVMSGGTVDSFTINGQKIVTNASTLFEGGLKADFAVGVKVEAEGPLDASGAIVALKVMFRSNIKIEADASAVTASSLTVLGKTVAINTYTRIDNGPLANTQHVEVRAFLDRDGNLVASRVVVKNADVRAFLQGPASVNAGVMSVLGVPVTTGVSTQFRISTDQPAAQATDSATFFAQVKNNVTVVKVRWATADTTLAVEQAEIQLGK